MRALLYGLLGLVIVAITIATIAPAQWLAAGVRSASHGRVDIAETAGTVWKGSGVVVLAASADPSATRASLPERLSWTMSPWSLMTGALDVTLVHPSALNQPLNLRAPLVGSNASLSPATLRLPASLLVGVGAPWNTVRPAGTLQLSWDRLQFSPGKMQGNITAEWQYAGSALTPVSPMGHYRLQTNGMWPGTQLELLTISGPLELTGSGTIREGGHLRFQGRAQAIAGTDPAVKSQLTGLLSLLGRRDGEGATLNFGS